MPYKIDWYVPRRVIYEYIWGEQTLEELQEVGEIFGALLDTGDAPVHFIADARELAAAPLNMATLRENFKLLGHPSLGWLVYIRSHRPLMNFLSEMLMRFFEVNCHPATSLEAALEFLRQQDPTIDWQTANESVTVNKE